MHIYFDQDKYTRYVTMSLYLINCLIESEEFAIFGIFGDVKKWLPLKIGYLVCPCINKYKTLSEYRTSKTSYAFVIREHEQKKSAVETTTAHSFLRLRFLMRPYA